MSQLIIFATTIILATICYFICKKNNKIISKLLKSLAVLFVVIGFFRFMLSDSFIWVINKGYYSDVYYHSKDVLQSIIRWGYYISYIVVPMAVFFENRIFRNVAIYFCLPFAILSTVFYGDFMSYFLDPAGRGLHLSSAFRYIYFGLELVIAMLLPILLRVVVKHKFDIKNKKEWRNIAIALPIIILQIFPVYLPQSLFGYTKYVIRAMSLSDIIWFVLVIISMVVIYLLYRFRPYKDRYMICVYFALFLFMHYNSLYLMGFSISRLPIQLCNLGAYFFLFTLIIKNKALFNFSFIANVVGTLIAMIMPDIEGGIGGFWNVHFIIEHSYVLIIPCLIAGLRIFPRLDKSSIKHIIIGFSCYFAFCLISGTILNGFTPETGVKVNFFYIFDLDKAFDYFSFISFSGKYKLEIGRFILYPLFQLIIYCGYLAICLGFYWVVLQFYKITDDHKELRCARMRIREEKTGKPSKLPYDFID